ncbi:hypothetical protein H5410_047943, partial [Solanum commersonii]
MYTTRNHRPPQFNFQPQFDSRQTPRKNHLYCDFCDMKGHTRTNCNKLKKCDHCHTTGHVKDNCYLLIGYPENFKGKKKANAVIGDGNMYSQMQNLQDHKEKKAHIAIGEHQMGDQVTQEHLFQLLNNTSPEQLNQIFNMLKRDNNNMDPQKSVNMAELTPCVVIRSATPIIVTEDATISASSSGHSHRDPNNTQLSDNVASVTSQDPELSVQTPTVVTRRSSRSAKPPIWHTNYVLTKKNTTAGSCSYSISDVVDYQRISPTYKSFVT